MDEADFSQAKEQALVVRRINAVRNRVLGKGSDTCIECGCDIPDKSRQAMPAAKTCVACQEAIEMTARGR